VPDRESVALVLAGGGARGAYEMGALSVLLPALEERGERPRLIIGTSIGALNTGLLAGTAELPAAEVVARGEGIWGEVRYGQVLSGLGSLRGLKRGLTYLGEVLGLPVRPTSILDPTPLERTVSELVPFAQLKANVAKGLCQAAVVTTSAATSRSVVFHTQRPAPQRDDKRGIDYVATELGAEHVRASAAIPVVFPAVRIEQPASQRGWYFDGGTRLNTPIKPALSLGAERVVVIGLNSIAARGRRGHDLQPDLAEGASQLIQAVLVDPLINDVQTLATENRRVQEARRANVELADRREIPYIFVAPREVDAIGRVAARVFNERYGSGRALLRSPDMAVLGRLVAGGKDPVHGELLSYLFFAAQFTTELLKLGRRDAQRWLDERHDEGPWRIGSPPPASR
jgi:NTE family protein